MTPEQIAEMNRARSDAEKLRRKEKKAGMSPSERDEYNRGQREAKQTSRDATEKRHLPTRANFNNTEENHVFAMEPGEGVDRHFKNHQDCPEANTFLNHLTSYRHHFLGDPEDPARDSERAN